MYLLLHVWYVEGERTSVMWFKLNSSSDPNEE